MKRDRLLTRMGREAVNRVVVARNLHSGSQHTPGDLTDFASGEFGVAGFLDFTRDDPESTLALVVVVDAGLSVFPEQREQHPCITGSDLYTVVGTVIELTTPLDDLWIELELSERL